VFHELFLICIFAHRQIFAHRTNYRVKREKKQEVIEKNLLFSEESAAGEAIWGHFERQTVLRRAFLRARDATVGAYTGEGKHASGTKAREGCATDRTFRLCRKEQWHPYLLL
jgi:hypothetical protein